MAQIKRWVLKGELLGTLNTWKRTQKGSSKVVSLAEQSWTNFYVDMQGTGIYKNYYCCTIFSDLGVTRYLYKTVPQTGRGSPNSTPDGRFSFTILRLGMVGETEIHFR